MDEKSPENKSLVPSFEGHCQQECTVCGAGTCPIGLDGDTKALRVDVDDNTLEIGEINARSEDGLRNRALTLSIVVTMLLIIAHIWFSYIGKTLAMPDIVWAIILGPWLGAGGSKIADIISKIATTKGK